MTAVSPYAPLRRQSSSLSTSNNGGRMIRRSSSIGAVVANGGAATLFYWIFVRFWRRIVSNNEDGVSGDGRIRDILKSMAGIVSSNLTMNDERNGDLSTSILRRRRRVPEVLRWLVTIVGGEQSKVGRVAVIMVGFVREVLLRSIGAANIILTGAPNLKVDSTNTNGGVEGSLANFYKPAHAHNHNERGAHIYEKEMDCNTIRQDRHQIDQVLNYWFGQASPDGAQKSLWMIASSSVELLDQVDTEISDKFRSMILDLSHSSLDDKNVDTMSINKGKLKRWTGGGEIFGWQGKMASIILLDQMSRHIHRHDKKQCGKTNQSLPEQQKLDSIAYTIAKALQNQHKKELSTGMIPLPMRIFGIMPLRHASTVQDLAVVQEDVEESSTLHDEMDRMIRRFRKATNRRMAALQDEARREGKLGLLDGDTKANDGGTGNQQLDDEKILECFPFKADMSKAHDHMVIKTMRAFLCKMNILQISDARFKSSRKCANSLQGQQPSMISSTPDDQVATAIVSLSGGVDSMVIASALAYLRDSEASRQNTKPENILHIIAIHIDYSNRPESGAEAAYVGRYCQEIGAKFVCRKIDEVKRGKTARDDYERIAREIRFGLYRQCCAEASNGTRESGIGIMLGHHRGDLRENVISNAHKGCGPLDLSGMTAVSKNDGVTLFRPLLTLEKTFIYDYSHQYGVPYFKDTTPHWSTRGKLRNRLLPLLEEIYGEGSMNNLSLLAEESDDARALIQQTVMGPFMDRVKRYPMGITFETSPWKDCGQFFWKFVLRQVLHSAGLGMFSDKSVESFLERISSSKLKEGWLQCRKDYAVFLQKDGRVFVFHPRSFPFGNGRKQGQYNTNSDFLGYGPESSIKVGPWTITSDVVQVSEEDANALLNKKALRNMEHLMAGDVQYFMKVPIASESALPSPLIRVTGFTKPTRPPAWKGFDLKVENTLPLLGVHHSAVDDVLPGYHEYKKTWVLVKVHLMLDWNKREVEMRDSQNENGTQKPQDAITTYGSKDKDESTGSAEVYYDANDTNGDKSSPDKPMRGLVLDLLVGDLGKSPLKES